MPVLAELELLTELLKLAIELLDLVAELEIEDELATDELTDLLEETRLEETELLELAGALDDELSATDDELTALLEEAAVLLELGRVLDATLELLILLDAARLDSARLDDTTLDTAFALDAWLETARLDDAVTEESVIDEAAVDERGIDEAILLELTGALDATLALLALLDAMLDDTALADSVREDAILLEFVGLLELTGALEIELSTGLTDKLDASFALDTLLEAAKLDASAVDDAANEDIRLLALTTAEELNTEELACTLKALELGALLASTDELSAACDIEDIAAGASLAPPLPPQAEIAKLSAVIRPSFKEVFFIKFPIRY